MAIASLREKLALMKRGKKAIVTKKKPRVKKEAEPVTKQFGGNIFEGHPNYDSLGIDRLVMEDNLEEEEEEENLAVIMDAIRFLNELELQATRINKERLMRKFNHNFPRLIIVDQLYCLVEQGSETFVDHCLDKLVATQKVKLIDLNNENFQFRLAILHEDYVKVVSQTPVGAKFLQLLDDYPNMLQIDETLLKKYGLDANELIHIGLLTISRQERGVYNISMPNVGPFLKIVSVGVKFVQRVCLSYKEKQVLEKDLVAKYNENHAIYRRMRGLNLKWLLSVMVGSGLLECYTTPVGRMYKMTGKEM